MTTKHTLGPWAYRPHEHDDWGIVRAPVTEQGQFMGGIICQARDPEALGETTLALHRARGTDPWEANARLIAAAPELVEALRATAAALTKAQEHWHHMIGASSPAALHDLNGEMDDSATLARALLARIDGEQA